MNHVDNDAHARASKRCSRCGDMSSGVHGLAFIGALVYFIGQADTFWQGVLGVLKAVIWPALAVYSLLGFLQV